MSGLDRVHCIWLVTEWAFVGSREEHKIIYKEKNGWYLQKATLNGWSDWGGFYIENNGGFIRAEIKGFSNERWPPPWFTGSLSLTFRSLNPSLFWSCHVSLRQMRTLGRGLADYLCRMRSALYLTRAQSSLLIAHFTVVFLVSWPLMEARLKLTLLWYRPWSFLGVKLAS